MTSNALGADVPYAGVVGGEVLPTTSEVSVSEQLQDLVLDSADVGEFLVELSDYSAALPAVGVGEVFDCAVTLHRRRRSATSAGNTNRARLLNDIQEGMAQGPCLSALEQQTTIVVQDITKETRWPEYTMALAKQGVRSMLAVPLALEQGASASINFFSNNAHTFDDGIIAGVEQYASHAQRALRLAVRIGVKQQLADDLQDAMKSRTVIDLAVGVIMGQQRCSQIAAFEILVRAASSRNEKLRDVARHLLVSLSGDGVDTHFDR